MGSDVTDTTPPPCSACRGTGRVISNLGGTPHDVTCPWCEGSGDRLPGHDAQAARRAEAAGDTGGAPPDGGGAAA